MPDVQWRGIAKRKGRLVGGLLVRTLVLLNSPVGIRLILMGGVMAASDRCSDPDRPDQCRQSEGRHDYLNHFHPPQ